MSTESPKTKKFAWEPTPEMIRDSRLMAFIKAHGLADYDALLKRADEDPGWF